MSSNGSDLTPDASSRWRRIALAVIVIGLGAFVWWTSRSTRLEPPVGGQVSPMVQVIDDGYVGRERCAQCHAEESVVHALSGHAVALARTKDSAIAMSLCGTMIPAHGGYGRFEYSCDEEGLMVAQPEKFADRRFPLDFAFGSGQHAVTFLTLTRSLDADSGIVGVEHRQTWYRVTGELGVTPGQQEWHPEREIEHFGRSFQGNLLERCISCHTTRFRMNGDQLEDLIVGVQCEACHGPGAEHVAAAEAGNEDLARNSLRTPRSPAEEIEACGQCHRLPSEIDPERLARYPPSLTRFQPVGLMQSRCYLQSQGRLGCLNCHDPHGPVSARTLDDQVAACRECHHAGGDALCAAGHGGECIGCHMRKLELVPGFTVHDHWIRRNPGESEVVSSDDDITVSGDPQER